MLKEEKIQIIIDYLQNNKCKKDCRKCLLGATAELGDYNPSIEYRSKDFVSLCDIIDAIVLQLDEQIRANKQG